MRWLFIWWRKADRKCHRIVHRETAFFRVITFNVATANCDDHLQILGFLFTPQVGCCYRLTDESALGWNSIVRRTTIHWISTWFLALRCIADWSRPREKRYSQRASIPFPAGENLLRNTVFPNQNKMLW